MISLGLPADWVALNATVNSTANLDDKDGKPTVIGNSTEGALLRWAREGGVEYGDTIFRHSYPPVDEGKHARGGRPESQSYNFYEHIIHRDTISARF